MLSHEGVSSTLISSFPSFHCKPYVLERRALPEATTNFSPGLASPTPKLPDERMVSFAVLEGPIITLLSVPLVMPLPKILPFVAALKVFPYPTTVPCACSTLALTTFCEPKTELLLVPVLPLNVLPKPAIVFLLPALATLSVLLMPNTELKLVLTDTPVFPLPTFTAPNKI